MFNFPSSFLGNGLPQQLSKRLTYALRHGAQDLGLHLRSDGFVRLEELLNNPKFRGVTKEQVEDVVSPARGMNCQAFVRFIIASGLSWIIREQLPEVLQYPVVSHPRVRSSEDSVYFPRSNNHSCSPLVTEL